MQFIARLIARHPKTIIATALVLTVGLGLAALRIERRVELEANLPRSNPRLAAFHEFRARYGSGSAIVAVMTGRDVFTPSALQAIDRLTRGLLALDGVRQVTSLTNLTEFRGDGDILRSGPLIAHVPENAATAAVLRNKILADPWYAGRLVSRDGRSTIIHVTLANADSLEEALATLKRVRSFIDRDRGGFTVHYAGSMVMDEQIDRCLGSDIAVLFPVVLIAIVAVLYLSFRSARGVVLPLVTVITSVIWTLGFMVLLGRPLSLVNNVMPVLLIGVGSAYGLHIVARFQEGISRGLDRREAVGAAVGSTGFSVWMAAITTVVGFGSLALSKMRMIFDFGVFSALGVALAFVISITVIPAVLILMPLPGARRQAGRRPPPRSAGIAHGLTERALVRSAELVGKHPLITLCIAVSLAILSVAGWPRMVTSFEPAEFLPAQSDHRQAEAIVDAQFGGSAELEVLVTGNLSDPRVLQGIERYQKAMQELGDQ